MKKQADNYHSLSIEETLKSLDTQESGLESEEISKRLEHYGKNEIVQKKRLNALKIFFIQFNSIFIYILIFAGIFSMVIGHYIDVIVIFIIIILNSIIGFVQQYKAEKIISEMKSLLVTETLVLREGKHTMINSVDLVPGDIMLLKEGDKVMADSRIIKSFEMETDESILTGESMPVKKSSEKIHFEKDISERTNILYMGTAITQGNCVTIAYATGANTEFGKIARIAESTEFHKSPLEEKIDGFSKKLAMIIVLLAIFTIALGFYRGEPFYEMFLTGIALAISVIPEGIPAIIAITLSIAIKKMKKKNALIRRLSAAETLGRTTVICTDKTGTLTENEMRVSKIYSNKNLFNLDDGRFLMNRKKIEFNSEKELLKTLRISILCNNAIIEKGKEISLIGTPTEKALIIAADQANLDKKSETEKEKRVIEIPFSSKRKLMSIVREKDNERISYVKGAGDYLIKKCKYELVNGKTISLTEKRTSELERIFKEMSGEALRVLGMAYKKVQRNTKLDEKNLEEGLIFAGFIGMIDLPRNNVKKSIEECKRAGIQIKMITGDSMLTAKAIADMIGLYGEAIEGHELENMSEDEFDKTAKKKRIFARITPELKLKIVRSLKKQGEIVAVTGDGVNDVLALKEAHIGVAMGIRGSDVAREAADIILLDDNFNSIVEAVKEGRVVYDNLKKSIKFHIGANFGELLLVMFAFILAFPLPILPLAILWMNLITDSLPSISLSFEKGENDIMKRSPKDPEESLLKGMIFFLVFAGIIMFASTLLLFSFFYEKDLPKARTIAITTAVFTEMFLVFTCRDEKKSVFRKDFFSNKFLIFSVILAVCLQFAAIYFKPIASVFGFIPLSFAEISYCIIFASFGLLFFEGVKIFKNMFKNNAK